MNSAGTAGARTKRRPYSPRLPASQRREQVLDAALGIILRDGYRAVSIEAIAREIGVTRPVVYHVFDRLEPLLHTLLDRQERRAVQQLRTMISTPPDPRDYAGHLRRTVTGMVEMLAADPATWKPILLASVDTPAMVRGRINQDRERVRAQFQTLVEHTVATRAAPQGVDAAIVSHTLLAIAEHFGRMLLEDPSSVDPDRLASTITALVLPTATTDLK